MHVGIVTRLRADFDVPKSLETGVTMRCRQGQKLQWLGLQHADQLHWFAVRDDEPLCPWCWEQSHCPREFSFAPGDHEIVFGTGPLYSQTAQRLLRQVRPWIEATQSFEKNQLALGAMFLNSLRLTWMISLLADTITLLRARALLSHPPARAAVYELTPLQLSLELKIEKSPDQPNMQKNLILDRCQNEFGNTLFQDHFNPFRTISRDTNNYKRLTCNQLRLK